MTTGQINHLESARSHLHLQNMLQLVMLLFFISNFTDTQNFLELSAEIFIPLLWGGGITLYCENKKQNQV